MNMTEKPALRKKTFKVPHTMTILFCVMLLCAVLTYVAPTGNYDRVATGSGGSVIDPDTYHAVDRNPTSPVDFMMAVPKGLQQQVTVFCMVLCSLGGIQLLNESKAIDAGILTLIRKYRKAELPAIVGMAVVYGVIGVTASWTIGFTPFIPITIAVVQALGYDALLGAAIVILPAASGWTSGVINVYSTALAQGFAELPLFSGLWMRLLSFFVFMAISLAFLISYARKYKKEHPQEGTLDNPEVQVLKLTKRRVLMLAWNAFALVFMAWGTTARAWSMNHISGWWIVVALVSGAIMGLNISDTFRSFVRGLNVIVGSAFVIAFASGILIILQEGNLMDSVVHGLSTVLSAAPRPLIGVLIFILTMVFNFFIAGVQGKVVTMMPLLAPLAETLGINRQVIVLAFIFGDGFTNWFWPTAAVCVAALGAANIDWAKWARFIWKPMLWLNAAAGVLVAVAQLVNYGPF